MGLALEPRGKLISKELGDLMELNNSIHNIITWIYVGQWENGSRLSISPNCKIGVIRTLPFKVIQLGGGVEGDVSHKSRIDWDAVPPQSIDLFSFLAP